MEENSILIRDAVPEDCVFAKEISDEMERSAHIRGTGIGKRSPETICDKICSGKAVIALTKAGLWVGFVYFELWNKGEYVSNCGLIVNPQFRGKGIASSIKRHIFELSTRRYPLAKIFGITTALSVLKMNLKLGFEPVTFNEITHEEAFWEKCKGCVNYPILAGKGFKNCLCTAMLYTPMQVLNKKSDVRE